jgi:spermidine synthase
VALFGALAVLFFVSGALGLLYEVAWFRRLQLVLGVSSFAIGAVVSAFMLGLAVGGRWAAQSAALRRAPLVAFARLELGLALYAAIFPLLADAVETLYPALFGLFGGWFPALSAARFVLALTLLLPPTFLMGASLPAMAEATVAPGARWAGRAGWLYALNTIGGVVGTLGAGFFLVEHLGITGTLYAGAGGSFLVGAAALALARHPVYAARATRLAAAGPPVSARSRAAAGFLARRAAVAAFAAGAVSLAAEVVWTRALVFFVHNSTYAFSAVLAVYLLGIGSGAGLAALRPAATAASALRRIAAALAGGSAALVLAIAVYRHLPLLAAVLAGSARQAPGLVGAPDGSALLVFDWWTALVVIFGQVAAVLYLPALALGAVFPLTLQLLEADGTPADVVGRLYPLNALGGVAGAVLGAFALVGLLGTRGALLLLAWAPVPVALWALRQSLPGRRLFWVAGLYASGLAVASMLAAPPSFYRRLFQKRFGRVTWFSEGVSDSVAVCEYPDGSRWIQFSDGRGASGTRSFQGGWLYAHLPLLLHPAPKSAVVICFGTGNTLGAASLHPLETLDGVELSPEVVRASRVFAETNHGVVENERVRVHIEDGRNYLLGTQRRFDVITEEPPLVHTAGVVNLYSKDFYELASRRLTEDGIMAVWLATWELEPEELRMLVRAFVDVFPNASAWDCTHPFEWLLIGSKRPLAIDLDVLAARMADPGLARDLARIDPELGGIRAPEDLLSLYMWGRASLVELAGSSPPVTDDKTVVDFTIPRRARANFGLGEWVTGGLAAEGVGSHGLRSETRLREFDRIYAFRERVSPLIADYGERNPERFARAVRKRAWAREMRAADATIRSMRRWAADHRAADDRAASLEVLRRGLDMVPEEARGPIHEMRAQLYREMGLPGEAQIAEHALRRAEAAKRRTAAALQAE